MTENRNRAIVDDNRSVCLCDAGQPGYVAAVCVTDDGQEALWLVNSAELEAERQRCGSADQPHEQLGALPAIWRHRVALAPLRCGRATKVGRPCRTPVAIPGASCARHRTAGHRSKL